MAGVSSFGVLVPSAEGRAGSFIKTYEKRLKKRLKIIQFYDEKRLK
jgi:hypothetical protein